MRDRRIFLVFALWVAPLWGGAILPVQSTCEIVGLSFGSGAGAPCEFTNLGAAVVVQPDHMWASPYSNWISTSQDAVLRWNEPFNEVPWEGATFYRQFSLATGGYSATIRAHADDNFNLELWNLDSQTLLYSYQYPTHCNLVYSPECSLWNGYPYLGGVSGLDGGVNYMLSFTVRNLYRSSFGLDYIVELTPYEPPIPEPSTWALVAAGLALVCWKRRTRRTT